LAAVTVALVCATVACGGGERNDGAATGPPGEAAPAAGGGAGGASGASNADCAGAELEATEVGITADTITVEVMADTGAQAIPGMANGSVEAIEAWADMVNEEGGLACRQVEVRTYDSKISPDESRNGYVDGCQNAFAMVGTFALSVADVTPLAECPDQAGEPTGLPEVPAVTQSVVHSCNPTTIPVVGPGQPCPPAEGERPVEVSTAPGEYIVEQVGEGAHGVYVMATTSPAVQQATIPGMRYMQDAQGLTADAEVGAKGSDTQSHYTPFAATINDEGSQFVLSNTTFPGFILLRREAASQGDDSVGLWLCQATCYDPAFIEAAGDVAEGTHVMLTHIPYEEAAENEEVQTFVDRVDTHNTFSNSSWMAARLFQQAVEDVVAADGPNALNRASLLEALEAVEGFDANGMIGPTTPSERAPSPCMVVVRVEGGEFTRAFPEEPGTFHCGDTDTIEIDPTTAFEG
jgi:ABC-type branched-subunit amino acid transport system substrate-binding protein